MICKDQLHREIQLKEIPKRIISLVPSQTELLVDLGLRDSIVGVTKFCIHPSDLRKEKTIVGGTKTIKVDKIKALNPDIILCNKEENSKEIVEALKPIAPIHISDVYTVEDSFQLITMYGELFNVKAKATQIIEAIQNKRNNFKGITCLPKKTAYFIWKKPWMVAASNTFVDFMINDAGFINVFQNETRYPEIDLDNNNLKQAEILMLSSEPFPFSDKHVEELQEIFPNKKVILVDGELFSWYGSRLKYSYQYFTSLHK